MSLIKSCAYFPTQLFDRWIGSLGTRFKKLDDYSGEEDVTNKVVVITGANGGLGLCVARQMAKRGAIVIMCCRNAEKTKNAVQSIWTDVPDAKLHVVTLDLGSLESVRQCASEIREKYPCISILINNAGIMKAIPKTERTQDGFEQQLGTNHLGHMLFTMLLLDRIRLGAPSRIVNVGSFMHALSTLKMDDLNWEQQRSKKINYFAPYSDSKRCQMLFSKELGRKLTGSGVQTYSVCPGMAATDLISEFPFISKWLCKGYFLSIGCSVDQGAAVIIYCALASEIAKETGQAYHFNALWPRANRELTDEEATQVWELSEKMLGTSFERHFQTDPPRFLVNVSASTKRA